ncbi:hypothetical protein C8Q77DRAFT_1148305 [Trametes polyzona]|nr:hypothetical protein C8Q77DRAFT_1148305 [Trametes polyzona]
MLHHASASSSLALSSWVSLWTYPYVLVSASVSVSVSVPVSATYPYAHASLMRAPRLGFDGRPRDTYSCIYSVWCYLY